MKKTNTYKMVFVALFAALTYACTLIHIPLLASKVHLGNSVSVLAGLILSPVDAGLAAGLGSMLFDATLGGYDALGCGITFVSKFAMAFVASVPIRLVRRKDSLSIGRHAFLTYIAAGISALTYVLLYMLKTFVMKQVVDHLPLTGVYAVMLEKLPASLINAGFATFVAPPLYAALLPALSKMGIMAKIK